MLRNFHEWSNAIPSFLNNVLSRRAHSLRAAGGCLWNNERVSNYEFSKGNGRNGYYFVEQVNVCARRPESKYWDRFVTKRIGKTCLRRCVPTALVDTISDRYFENGSR